MEFIFIIVQGLLCLLFGAWCIGDAVEAFKNNKYFSFGLNVMFSIVTILQITRLQIVSILE